MILIATVLLVAGFSVDMLNLCLGARRLRGNGPSGVPVVGLGYSGAAWRSFISQTTLPSPTHFQSGSGICWHICSRIMAYSTSPTPCSVCAGSNSQSGRFSSISASILTRISEQPYHGQPTSLPIISKSQATPHPSTPSQVSAHVDDLWTF